MAVRPGGGGDGGAPTPSPAGDADTRTLEGTREEAAWLTEGPDSVRHSIGPPLTPDSVRYNNVEPFGGASGKDAETSQVPTAPAPARAGGPGCWALPGPGP